MKVSRCADHGGKAERTRYHRDADREGAAGPAERLHPHALRAAERTIERGIINDTF